MNRVGIITHYHDSLNYGGVLQAYALCSVLREYGMESEQICFPLSGIPLPWQRGGSGNRVLRFMKNGTLFRKAAHRLKRTVEKLAVRAFIPHLAAKRKAAFRHFTQELTPHSATCYYTDTIARCADQYDLFITGSDQVWNLRWYNPAYFLAFAGEGKPKFSYAASLALQEMTQQQNELFQTHLKDFICVSVREVQAAEQLRRVLDREVEWVLDPTLLLTGEQWDKVCGPRMVDQPYLFCYFLGHAPGARRLARRYAKRHGLKVVTIPHLDGLFVPQDVFFGDIRVEAPSPENFLSLIKYAQCVFTDSFHATAFSANYHREYFVFPRSGSKGMDDRIYSLIGLLGSESRFCDCAQKRQLSYLLSCEKLDYTSPAARLEEKKAQSLKYLEKCLAMARDWTKKDEN